MEGNVAMNGTIGIRHPLVRMVLAITIVLTGVVWPVQLAPEAGAQSQATNANWMGDMADAIGNVPLNRVVLPGTHDAGTYAISPSSEESPDSPLPAIKEDINQAVDDLGLGAVVGLIDAIGPTLKPILASWAKTQDHTMSQQLAGGVRYFDLRVCPKGNELYICHSLYGENITVILDAVRQFIDAHPDEIVLLDFNNLDNNDVPGQQREFLAQTIISTFTTSGGQPGDLLVSSELGPTATLNDIWATRGRVVILFADPDEVEDHHPHLWLGQVEDSSAMIQSPWPNKNNVDDQKPVVFANLACRCDSVKGTPAATDQLFVLQTQPTPDDALIGASVLEQLKEDNSSLAWAFEAIRNRLGWPSDPPNDLKELAESANHSIVRLVLNQSLNNAQFRQNLNIVQADYYDLTLVEGAKTLNAGQVERNLWLGTAFISPARATLDEEGQIVIGGGADLHLRRSPFGTLFSSPSHVGNTIARPAFAAPGAATEPYIAWTDADLHIHVGVVDESGTGLSHQLTLPNASSYGGPALAVLGDQLFVAWTQAADGQVRLMSLPIVGGVPQLPQLDSPAAQLGVTALQYMTSDGQSLTLTSPALSVFNGQLYLAWTAPDLELHLGRIDTDGPSLMLQTNVSLGEGSIFGPALAVFKGNLYLLWAGTEEYPGSIGTVASGPLHIGQVANDGSGLVTNTVMPHSDATSEPSLAAFQDQLYITWVGQGAGAGSVFMWRTNDAVTFSAELRGNFGEEIKTGLHIGPALLALPGPSLSVTASTADGPYTAGTWTNQAVEVTFTCAASGGSVRSLTISGAANVESTEGQATVTIESEGHDQTLYATCEDSGGLTSQISFGPIQIDKTKPAISSAAMAGDDVYLAETWTNRDVIVNFTCADAGNVQSGIATDTLAGSTVSDETAGTSVASAGTCVDNAGNEADPVSFGPVKIDKTKPLITASAAISNGQDDMPTYTAGTWINQDVIVSFTCAEAGDVKSGIVTNTLVNQTLTLEGGNHSVTSSGSCLDDAGNAADPVTFGPVRIDKTAPIIDVGSPSDTPYLLNEVVAAEYTCTDPLLANGGSPSGVATCVGTVAGGDAIDTGSVGSKNFTVGATDNAGNASQANVSYNVGYRTNLQYDNGIAYPAGEKIPLRLELWDVNGMNVSNKSIVVTAVGIADGSGVVRNLGEVFKYTPPGGPNPGMYLYKIDTAGLASGSYTLLFTAGDDPTVHEVPFSVE